MYIMDLQDSKKALYVMEFFSGPMFNDWINKCGLMKTKLANRGFAYSNNQDNTIFSTIDRFFLPLIGMPISLLPP